MTTTERAVDLPDDVAAAAGTIADRLRTKTVDQVIEIGERTGWWTAELVDWVAEGRSGAVPAGPVAEQTARQQDEQRLEELQEQLAEAGVVQTDTVDVETGEQPIEDGVVDVELAGRTVAGAMLLEEARASVALDGETQTIGGAYTATTPQNPVAAAPASYIAVLKASELGVDHSYQRPLDEPRVRRMAAAWDSRMVGAIDVSDRGPTERPRYAVINGQHRAAAAARVSPEGGDVRLACTVHEGLDVAAEAALMYELDRTTKKLSGFDQWRARRGAGDPAVVRVETIVAKHGLRIDPAPSDGCMRSYGTAEKLLSLGGDGLLDSSLAVLRAAYGDAPTAYQAPLLMGVGQLLHRTGEHLNVDRLRRALSATRPEQLRSTATALREVEGGPLHELMSRAIAGQYNRTPGDGSRITGSR